MSRPRLALITAAVCLAATACTGTAGHGAAATSAASTASATADPSSGAPDPAGSGGPVAGASTSATAPATATATSVAPAPTETSSGNALPGMPPVLDPHNVYAADTPTDFAPAVKGALSRVYVPDSEADTVDVVDPATGKVLKTLKVGKLPQHVVPSWDLKTLWVTDDLSNDLMAIDPRTATIVRTVPVDDPYNMYFTPDGHSAMVMAEAQHRIDFRDAQSMAVQKRVHVDCKGVDHGDFTADGRFFLASCEFSGQLIVVDVARQQVVGYISLGSTRYGPQDVKLSPDGKTFYVADMNADGVWLVDATTWKVRGLLPTGKGAHGLYVSRDAKTMYVTNRDAGSIGLIDLATGTLRTTWQLGPNTSPDMGNLNAAGTILWLSGRYNSALYEIDTSNGHLIRTIHTGKGPHGVCVWPQPGRYSLGHTGILR